MANIMDKGHLRQTFSENGAFAPLSEMPLPVRLAEAIGQEIAAMQQKEALQDEQTATGQVHEKAKEDGLRQHQLTVRGKAEDSNLIESNAVNESSDNPRSEKGREKKRKERNRLIHSFLRGMENWSASDHFQAFNNFTNWMDRKADEFEKQAREERTLIAANIEKMQANSDFISEADTLLQAHKTGKPVNPEEIRRLLKKQGIEVDEDVPLVVLLDRLETARNEADSENQRLDQENVVHEETITMVEAKAEEWRKQAQEIRSKVDQINDDLKNGRITEEEAKEEMQNIWEGVPDEVVDEYKTRFGEMDPRSLQVADQQTQQQDIEHANQEGEAGSDLMAEFASAAFVDVDTTQAPDHSTENDLKNNGTGSEPNPFKPDGLG